MKFSCVIPVFNTRPDHLLEAFYSILNQTLKANEIIIVDDGSTCAKTKSTLRFIESNFDIKLFCLEKNGGTSEALNLAHGVAPYDYLAIMGSDDISHPDRFSKQIDFLNRNKNTDILGTGLFAFKDTDLFRRPIFTKSHPDAISLNSENKSGNWVVNHGTVIYSRKVFANYKYDTKYRRGQDVNLWLVLLNNGFTFRNIPDTLYAYRRY
jgi:glycosyltransferase involved in cell wall biosynthesis